MQTIPLESILIPEERQRREFDSSKLYELQCSIAARGLLHPIVLRSPENPSLVAGERRLKAIAALAEKDQPIRHNGETSPVGQIPVTYMGELSEAEYAEAELEENIQRMDLSWQERANAITRLHTLRKSQNPKHTQDATVEELLGSVSHSSQGTQIVRDAEILNRFLDDPEVAKAKNASEAMKVIKKRVAREERAALAKNHIASRHTHLQGDCRELLLHLPADKFDVIITDPPYGIGADEFGTQTAIGHHYEDSEAYALEIVQAIATEGFRVCKAQAHLYLFGDVRLFSSLKDILESAGWDVWNTPLIWKKRANQGMLPKPEHGPRRTYEIILFANKGNRKVTGVSPDVLDVENLVNPRHAAEKPPALYMNLLGRSCLPGDKVLDPCAGAGPIFPAANTLQLDATAFNFDPDDWNMAQLRLDEEGE